MAVSLRDCLAGSIVMKMDALASVELSRTCQQRLFDIQRSVYKGGRE